VTWEAPTPDDRVPDFRLGYHEKERERLFWGARDGDPTPPRDRILDIVDGEPRRVSLWHRRTWETDGAYRSRVAATPGGLGRNVEEARASYQRQLDLSGWGAAPEAADHG
jgi:hypothetical protein